MRIRWRGFELPNRVVRDDSVSTDSYGRFVIEPFEQGFGTTIGNSLRRVLLSSLEGAAITTVKIAGVSHEFTSIDGILEDVTDILLNIKGIVLRADSDESKTAVIRRSTAGEVRAGDLEADASVVVVNRDHRIATLTADVNFHVELKIAKGRGYATASENRTAEQELGVISVDSIYSPVLRVRYRTEDMRVGQRTNYDRLILEVWTNGTVSPGDALVEAAAILRKHLTPFMIYHKLGDRLVTQTQPLTTFDMQPSGPEAWTELLQRPVSSLGLSVRASNCLDAAKITTIRQLVERTEMDLLRFRSFGKTSLHEVQRRLAEVGLRLGMEFDETGRVIERAPLPDGLSGEAPDASFDASGEKGISSDESPLDDADAPNESSVSANAGSMEAFTMPDN